MTEPAKNNTPEIIRASLARRHRAEKRFRCYGIAAISFGMLAVVVLLVDIVSKGHGAFQQTYVQLEVHYDPTLLDIDDARDPAALIRGNFQAVVRAALRDRLGEVSGRAERREQNELVSNGAAYELRERMRQNPALLGAREILWLAVDDDIDTWFKSRGGEEFTGRISDRQMEWMRTLEADGEVALRFNADFFTSGDSREPEQAGIGGAIMGSLLTLVVTLALVALHAAPH